jgi:septum formation protein
MSDTVPLILASQSLARRRMLSDAGLKFECQPSGIDEQKLKEVLVQLSASEPEVVAKGLAMAKAVEVSERNPGAYVIGSDQVLALEQDILGKASDVDGARRTLHKLRGKTHTLHSAVCLARHGGLIWTHVDYANLSMRKFSEAWLKTYLENAGEALTSSVGCYHLEGRGAQLFEDIQGDYFTILGMPLLPLLAELRRQKVIPA